jgi:hypothetical protein
MKRKLKDNPLIEMSFDLFEREYADDITWQTEVLLGDAKDGSAADEAAEYDLAYEEAILIVAEEKGFDLI